MKPEDVMRALECCTFNPNCEECPFTLGREDCTSLDQHALALLREKDAEIERLRRGTFTCEEFMNSIPPEGIRVTFLDRREIRAEAITEFEQRLITYYNALKSGLVAYHIEQVAKEMRDKL